MSVPFETIKLDRERKIRFPMSVQIQIEAISGKRIHDVISEADLDLNMKMLLLGLKTEDKDLTAEKLMAIVEEYTDSTQQIADAVASALVKAIAGPKAEQALKDLAEALEPEDVEEKNLMGPEATGINS